MQPLFLTVLGVGLQHLLPFHIAHLYARKEETPAAGPSSTSPGICSTWVQLSGLGFCTRPQTESSLRTHSLCLLCADLGPAEAQGPKGMRNQLSRGNQGINSRQAIR